MKKALRQVRSQLRFALGVALRRPFDVCVQVTNRCNLSCSFCGFWKLGGDPAKELTVAEYYRVSDELSQLGSFLVSLEGGEPLLRPDLPDIVAAFARHHLPVIYTNGWLVEPTLARALFDAGLTQAGVSIDFPDAERHDRARGQPDSHRRAWNAVRILREAAPHRGAQVHVLSILMQDNQDDLEALLRESQRQRVGHHVTLISPGRVSPPARDRLLPSRRVSAELLELHRRFRHFATFREYLARIDPFVEGEVMPRCGMGRQMFNLTAAGDVTPCNERLSLVVGNVRQEPFTRIHERLARIPEVGRCQDCWQLCRGFSTVLGAGGSRWGWVDLATRMSSR